MNKIAESNGSLFEQELLKYLSDTEETSANNSSKHHQNSTKTKDSKATTKKAANSTEKVKEKAKDSEDYQEESQYGEYEESGDLKSVTEAVGKLKFIENNFPSTF